MLRFVELLGVVIWRLLEVPEPHFGAFEACFDRFQEHAVPGLGLALHV